ncbi:LysR substrate-binding domain-containing protein [Nonomuraea sp. NPDC050733]|uniref:LysR substrate-binding domain-containing protein n=1 Tax=Nonomuraea sp. NPDC050733 TaxID=3154633 RepID=UPI0033F64D68
MHSAQVGGAFAALRRGDIDVLVSWLPIDEPDLTVGPVLFAEQRVLAVATDHQLVARASVSLEMISDFQHPNSDTGPGYWFDAYIPRLTRRGRQIERGPVVRDAGSNSPRARRPRADHASRRAWQRHTSEPLPC